MEKKELKFEILNELGVISESSKGWKKRIDPYKLEWGRAKIRY